MVLKIHPKCDVDAITLPAGGNYWCMALSGKIRFRDRKITLGMSRPLVSIINMHIMTVQSRKISKEFWARILSAHNLNIINFCDSKNLENRWFPWTRIHRKSMIFMWPRLEKHQNGWSWSLPSTRKPQNYAENDVLAFLFDPRKK